MLLFNYKINVSDADCQMVVVCVSGSAHTIFLLKIEQTRKNLPYDLCMSTISLCLFAHLHFVDFVLKVQV